MSEKAAQQRIDGTLKEEDALDHVLAAQNQKIKESIGNYKFWLAVELRKAHWEIFRLQEERDLLIKETIRLKKIVAETKESINR